MEPILKVDRIVKTFPGVKALDGVCLNVYPGEIHTLLGENGAGKSTLMNVLNGLYSPDSGEILIDGKRQVFGSPKDSLSAGIGMVHQHFMLIYSHTVFENILLAVGGLPFFLNRHKLKQKIEAVMERFDLSIDLDAPIWKLSIGQQQWVELIKLLIRDCRVLILDEPTAVLTPQEADRLFEFLYKLREEGRSVIFISHKMREVMELSDRVTILKKGAAVNELVRGGFDEKLLADLMIGMDEVPVWERTHKVFNDTILKIENLYADKDKNMSDVINLNLELRKGEILGIAGVAGNGQKTLAEVLTGLKNPKSGKITTNGIDITNADSRQSHIAGIAHVPEDRKSMGIAPEMSVDDNLILKSYKQKKFRKFFFQNKKAIRENAEKQIHDFAIKAGPKGTPIRLLSGGNIQKVIIARELSLRPNVLVALYPTRGLDIGSAEYVHKVLMEARDDNMSTILISEDLDELLKLADRIAVMFRGEITGIVDPEHTSREEIGLLMSGEAVL